MAVHGKDAPLFEIPKRMAQEKQGTINLLIVCWLKKKNRYEGRKNSGREERREGIYFVLFRLCLFQSTPHHEVRGTFINPDPSDQVLPCPEFALVLHTLKKRSNIL